MLKKYRTHLEKIGLTAKESAVYLALLEHGALTADGASKRADLNRSTTYVQIEQLMALGLVSTFKRGKKTYFSAESPHNLERLLERQQLELEQKQAETAVLLPDLVNIFATTGDRPVIRSFEGKEGLMSMRNEMLDSGTKEIFVATDYDRFVGIFNQKELEAYSSKRAKKKITSYVLYTKEGDDLVEYKPQKLKRVTESKFPFGTEVYIYNDCVSFTSYDDSMTGILITSKSIADTMKGLFWHAWNS